jgi:hypothetical protein
MNFNSILIGSEDPQRLVDYYTKLFGQPSLSDGGYTGWQIGSGFVTVGPHSEVKGQSTAATEVSRLRIPEESSPASHSHHSGPAGGFPARFEQLGLHELKAWPSRELLSRGPRRVGIRLLGARSHLPRMASQPVE